MPGRGGGLKRAGAWQHRATVSLTGSP